MRLSILATPLRHIPMALYLRLRTPTTRIQKSFLVIDAIHCSAKEIHQIRSISKDCVINVAQRIKDELDYEGDMPIVYVICMGSAFLPQRIKGIPNRLLSERTAALYRKSHRRIYVIMDKIPRWSSLDEVISHEITHALIHCMSNGFTYPRELEEGLAVSMEGYASAYCYPGRSDRQKNVNKKDYIPVQTLLGSSRTSESMRYAISAWWLLAYIKHLSRQLPTLAKLFCEIRQRDLKCPEDVYEWLMRETEMDADEFETRFRAFCCDDSAE